ncbi:MAG TPA: pyridoxine 5'-phosphate synthase [Candidatus Eisenbacteria bacterium]|nr:pyridoxine 5'-phosphate synthase [Candidatus Eisenbacteria bacterium]
MLKLGVNIDHVATVRQARGGSEPDPVRAARICQKAGAHSIVMHLREDRRHIQDADLFRVRDAVRLKINLEMSIAPSVLKTAARLRPPQVTLVPERRMERTTEGGLDAAGGGARLRRALDLFRSKKIGVSLFIDPDPRQVDAARDLGVDAVEFHTGDYANRSTRPGRLKELRRLERAAGLANEAGLLAHAGHGLDYDNVLPLKKIEGLRELNIGYSIVVRALWVGLDRAVREMADLIR